jgi:hypothetical protein
MAELDEINLLRTRVIELVATMEPSIDLALALHHARSVETAYTLLTDVYWRIPLDARIDQLERAVADAGLRDAFPLTIPISHQVVDIRNLMAHSIVEPTAEGIQVLGRRRGQDSLRLIKKDDLKWLAWHGERCNHDLDLISARIGNWGIWAKLHGFDDRRR